MLVHNVYFTLIDNSPAARQKMVAACKKYLTGHGGTHYFSVGILCDTLRREVNMLDFDVGLHMVFTTKADHDAYQVHPRHEEFIAENKANWKQVRVFDSLVD